jgi:hypothetical protein
MNWKVFDQEWEDLFEMLYAKGIVIQCFFVSEDMMEGHRRVVWKGSRTTVPAEVAPFLCAGKYAFEAFRNLGVHDNAADFEKEARRRREKMEDRLREAHGDQDRPGDLD